MDLVEVACGIVPDPYAAAFVVYPEAFGIVDERNGIGLQDISFGVAEIYCIFLAVGYPKHISHRVIAKICDLGSSSEFAPEYDTFFGGVP